MQSPKSRSCESFGKLLVDISWIPVWLDAMGWMEVSTSFSKAHLICSYLFIFLHKKMFYLWKTGKIILVEKHRQELSQQKKKQGTSCHCDGSRKRVSGSAHRGRKYHHGTIYPNGPSGCSSCRRPRGWFIIVEGNGCTHFLYIFTPNEMGKWEMIHFDLGWFNHQLDRCFAGDTPEKKHTWIQFETSISPV